MSDDYTFADGDPINFDYSLVVRSDSTLNIAHNLSTSANDTNTGIVYLGFDAGHDCRGSPRGHRHLGP